MSSETSLEERATQLVDQLAQLREDRGAMANLRRGFSSATEDRAWPWIARWCDLSNDHQRIIHTAVAAAFATHPDTAAQGNLGLSMRQLAQCNQKDDEAIKRFEPRFRRFLNCHSSPEICQILPGVIRMAKQQGVPINYRQLFIDLCCWNSHSERVKVRWAAQYWGTEKGTAT